MIATVRSRYPFTINQYERLIEVGVLVPENGLEPIRGDLLKMLPIGRRHAACVNRLGEQLRSRLGNQALIAIQNPIQLDDHSQPQPDVAVWIRQTDSPTLSRQIYPDRFKALRHD